MITDRRVFDDRTSPRQLLHREAELDQLLRLLSPATRGPVPSAHDVLLSGPMGVGKTALARRGLDRLDREADHVASTFVRCHGADAEAILRDVVSGHPRAAASDVGADLDVAALRDRLRDVVDDPFVVVLDEADTVPRTEVLDELAGIPPLSLVCICHDPDRWRSRLAPDVATRFDGDRAISLDRYRTGELADILEQRADAGLAPDVVDRDLLRTIADEAAGVARVGIQALGAAAEVAVERDADRVREHHLPKAFERARSAIREQNLDSLSIHHRVLYAVVRDAGEINAGALHDRYREVAADLLAGQNATPVSRRTRRNHLSKLQEYDLIERQGENRHTRYRVVDDTVVPSGAIEARLPEV